MTGLLKIHLFNEKLHGHGTIIAQADTDLIKRGLTNQCHHEPVERFMLRHARQDSIVIIP
jgi:hypothetical protein